MTLTSGKIPLRGVSFERQWKLRFMAQEAMLKEMADSELRRILSRNAEIRAGDSATLHG